MDEIWNGDRAVLSAVVELYETTGAYVEPQQVLDAFPVEQHGDVLHSLRRCGGGSKRRLANRHDQERHRECLRTSGAWPNDAELLVDRILEVLAERAEHEREPEKQSKYQAGPEITRDVFIDVVGTALAKSMPGG